MPTLAGVVNVPIIRADGSIQEQPGYDEKTGLLYDPGALRYRTVPLNPSYEDAQAALSLLESPLSSFPFVGEAHRSVALSGILTPVARPSLPTAPMHAMDAPTAGTGKSALVDIASMIVTGHRAAVISQGNNEAELEKRLGASLIAGDALISIDNCERPLGGETLCQALTQERIKVRILGQSKYVEAPTKAVFFATGNNLVMVGDMCRRALKCSLDAGLERPERRQFSSDPIKTIAANRERYVEAAITVLRAFEVAGRPKQARSLGGFEDWSSRVRDCLIWLGRADPCETMEEIRSVDPAQEELRATMEQWASLIGDQRLSVRSVINLADERRGDGYKNADFREALLSVAGAGGAISGRRLGKWLGRNKGRIIDGQRFVPDGLLQGFQLWKLERV